MADVCGGYQEYRQARKGATGRERCHLKVSSAANADDISVVLPRSRRNERPVRDCDRHHASQDALSRRPPRSQQPIGNKKFYFVREDSSVTRATAPADGTTDLQKGVLIGSLRLRVDLDYSTDGHRFAGISLCITRHVTTRHVTTVRGT